MKGSFMAVKKVARAPLDKNILAQSWGYLTTIASGMMHTGGILLKQLTGQEKSNTKEWPEVPANYSERFKGKHFLTRREDGEIRCTACFLCATACPADCIHIEAGQHPDKDVEKYPLRFEIDILRCVFCGFCEEACPVDAIRLGPEFAMVGGTQDKWVYTKEHLAARPELVEGISSVKRENIKHPSVHLDESQQVGSASKVPHGGVAH